MSGGSVAGLTGVNAAPCVDLPVNANSPSLVETMSPGRKVGSRLTSNEVRPKASLPFAGAIGHQLLAVQVGGVERGVTLAVLGDSGGRFRCRRRPWFCCKGRSPGRFPPACH